MADRKVTFDVLAIAKALGFEEAGSKIKKFADDSKGKVSGLVTAIAAIGPAAIPAAAGAGAALVGLGAAGGVALLAFKGISAEMKQGSVLGKAYQQAFAPVVNEYHSLRYLAADAMFASINSAVQQSKTLFPDLAHDVYGLSSQFGQILANMVPGLLAFFHDLQPLIAQVGDALVKGSSKFKDWAISGQGVQGFLKYAQDNLPKVEQLLGELLTAVSHLVLGLAPLGGVSLSTIGIFLKLFNAIPVDVLQELAPLISGIVVATKLWSIATAALDIVLDANPVVLIAAAIVGLGIAFVHAYQHSETFRSVVKTVFHDVELAFLYAGKFAIQYLLIPVLDVFSGIVHGAAAAFGWVPGIGGKLKKARSEFDSFRKGVDKSLHGINVQIDTLQAGKALAHVHDMISQLKDKKISIQTYVQQVIEPTLDRSTGGVYGEHSGPGHRASGGPVYAGRSYIVGEKRPELFTPGTNGYIHSRVPSGSGEGMPIVLEYVPSGNKLVDALFEEIRRGIRVRGGNVQKALGQ